MKKLRLLFFALIIITSCSKEALLESNETPYQTDFNSISSTNQDLTADLGYTHDDAIRNENPIGILNSGSRIHGFQEELYPPTCVDGCCEYYLPTLPATYYTINGRISWGEKVSVCPGEPGVYVKRYQPLTDNGPYCVAYLICNESDCPLDCSGFSINSEIEQTSPFCCKINYTFNVPPSLQNSVVVSGIADKSLSSGTQMVDSDEISITLCGNVTGSTVLFKAALGEAGCLQTVSHTFTSRCN